MYNPKNKVCRLNVNAKGSITRSKLKTLEMKYVSFGALYGSRVCLAVKTSADYTSIDLTWEEAVELQKELTRAIEESKNMATEFDIKNSA